MNKYELWECYNIILEWMYEVDKLANGMISNKYSLLQSDIRDMLDFIKSLIEVENGRTKRIRKKYHSHIR